MVLFTFPEDARWNAERMEVEFGVEVGEYRGVVHVPRRIFQHLLTDTPTPERCVEAYHLHRTRFELIAERKGAPQAVDRRWKCRDHRSRPYRRISVWETDVPVRRLAL
jgi:hypothetical protein